MINHKRLFRIYQAAKLQVRRRRKVRVNILRVPLAPAERPNQRWSMDFVSDQFGRGRRFRCLTIVDDYTREFPAIEADISFSGERIGQILDRLAFTVGLPEVIVTDNGA